MADDERPTPPEPPANDPAQDRWTLEKQEKGGGSLFSRLPRLKRPAWLSRLPQWKKPSWLSRLPRWKKPSWLEWLPGGVTSWAAGAGLFVALLLIYVLVASLTGGSPSPRARTTPPVSPSPSAQPVRACAQPQYIATVATKHLAARKAPRASAHVIKTFGKKSVLGAPQVFLVKSSVTKPAGDSWLRVLLPVRPNGTYGYVPTSKVTVAQTLYRLKVVRNQFSLWFYDGCRLVKKYKVGIGAGKTPTPVGNFYLQALYKLPTKNTVYGTYAYALSGYSNVITDWKFGGIVGLHGTNDPKGSIGHYVSHGCIRMRNADVESLIKKLPLGTPIEID